MRRVWPLLLLLIAALVAGCKDPQLIGGVARKKMYRKVVSLSPSTSEILAANGIALAGRTAACTYPSNVTSAPIVAQVKPDYEKLAEIKPDLIVYDKSLYGDADVQKIKALGIDTFEYNPQSIEEMETQIYQLGNKVGAETSLSSYVDKVVQMAGSLKSDQPKSTPKTAVILPDATGRHMISGTKGFLAEEIKIAGGVPVGPDSDKFEAVSPESLISLNPEVIFVSGDKQVFLKDARFAGLAAVKNGQVYGVPADILLRRGARVDLLLKNLAKAVHFAAQGSASNAMLYRPTLGRMAFARG